MARVLFENTTKTFDNGVTAVKNMTLEVKDKDFLVMVGPSGCGKTTALRMVAGLEEVTGGKIYIGDRLVNDIAPKERNIAMVFQNYALYPHMKVYDNMAFGLKLRKFSKKEIDRRVKDAAEILEIGNMLDRLPKQLSGGQRHLYFDSEDFKVVIPNDFALMLEKYLDKNVIFGIRPADIHSTGLKDSKYQCQLEATVDFRELMGSETYLYLKIGKTPLVVRVDAMSDTKPGSSYCVYLNLKKFHMFDPETQKAII